MIELLLTSVGLLVANWGLYNSALGFIGLLFDSRKVPRSDGVTFSIVVPVKNEERVLPRLLDRLVSQQYDKSKYEIIVVEDSSTDGTLEVCRKYERSYPNVKCLSLPKPNVVNGKARGINVALKVARGEVIGIFDADSVPSLDVLPIVASLFAKGSVAVQVKLQPINVRESLIARLASLEELLYEYSLIGRSRLGLFVSLEGTGSFIRKDVLESLGGFEEYALTEDLALSIKLYLNGMKVDYVTEAVVWREVPPKLSWLVKQRLRWYRGHLELVRRTIKVKGFRLSYRAIDGYMIVLSPVIVSLYPIGFLLAFYLNYWPVLYASTLLSFSTLVSFLLTLAITRRHMIETWFAMITPVLVNLIVGLNVLAVVVHLLGLRREWVKTERSGVVFDRRGVV